MSSREHDSLPLQTDACVFFVQPISRWLTVPGNASTLRETRWGFSPKWRGGTLKRSWRSGPKCMLYVKKNLQKVFNTRQMLQSKSNFHRGAHGHTEGSRPWAWAENKIEELMAHVVGKRHLTLKKRRRRLNWGRGHSKLV